MSNLWTSGNEASEVKDIEHSYTLAEIAEHNGIESCWMIIGGDVYDLTEYLPLHPTSLNVILPVLRQRCDIGLQHQESGAVAFARG